MESTWVFKPKYDVATCNKLVGRFADRFLNWHEQGIDWNIREVRAGWFELRSIVSEPSMMEYWTDTCVHDTELDAEDLTEGMMVLLVEAGIAYEADRSGGDYILEDVDMARIITVLCEENTNVYCPMGASCWVQPADGIPKHVDMLEALLTLQIA